MGASQAQTRGDDRELIDSFRNELRRIRTEYEDLQALNAVSPKKKESRYSLALTAYENIYNADHVFRYCLADLEKVQHAREDLWSRDAAKYKENSDAYDRLLGDFIPRILRDRVRGEIAYNAYTGGSNASASDDWDMYRTRLRERRQKNTHALSTGIPALDRKIGGLPPKLTVLAGVTGTCKTALASSMTIGALHAHPDIAAVFYSLDMSKDAIYDRLLRHQSGLDYREFLRNHDDPGVTCRLSAEAKLAGAILPRLRVVERGQLGTQKDQLVQALIRHGYELKQMCGAKRALHVLDYFQIMGLAKNANNPNEADYERIAVLKAAQEATCNPDCPDGDCFLVLSEVRKGESGRSRLSLDDWTSPRMVSAQKRV